MSKSSLVTARLYRNLLRTAKLYTAPSPNAAVLTSLLHRSGIDDHIQDWHTFVSEENKSHNDQSDSTGRIDVERARDLTQSYSTEPPLSSPRYSASQSSPRNNRTYQRLFRRLLREVVTGTNGFGKMIFPSQANTSRLMEVIQREFRASRGVFGGAAASVHFDEATRQKVAFTALRELHKKLSYFDWLSKNSPEPMLNQASWRVSSLPTHPPASYLRPGVFLVSHPYMHDSYFSKSVICILEHKGLGSSSSSSARNSNSDDEDEQESDQNPAHRRTTAPPGQTYGVIINRVSLKNDTGEHRTLKEVFREHLLPDRMADVFGDSVVREGGPVHVALQMIHSVPAASSVEEDDVGGTVIPFVSKNHDDNNNDPEENPAFYSDRATYFQGNMFKTMSQVEKGKMDRDDVSFFVGASIWSPGQLAAEIAQGYWIPCRGPPEMALDGICEHEEYPDDSSFASKNRPLADLWLSMMSACGTEEAKLSHLFHHDHWDENGMPCDDFGDDDDDVVIL